MEWISTKVVKKYCLQFISQSRKQLSLLAKALSSCDLCGQLCETELLLCDTCINDLPKLDMAFYQGDLLNNPNIHRNIKQIKFDRLISVGRYDWPFDQWISQFKYRRRFELAKVLAKMLNQQLQMSLKYSDHAKPEVVIPVPLHWFKQTQRTFNQSALLAQYVSEYSGVELNLSILKRKQYTRSQVGQSGVKRRKNLKNVFTLIPSEFLLPKHVILVDDVVTTGATVNEISKLLRQHGVETITVLSLALAT